jgi:hypothetical protein
MRRNNASFCHPERSEGPMHFAGIAGMQRFFPFAQNDNVKKVNPWLTKP